MYPATALHQSIPYPSTSSAPPILYPAVSSAPPVLYPHIQIPQPSTILREQRRLLPQVQQQQLLQQRRLLPYVYTNPSAAPSQFSPFSTLYAPVSATYAPVPPNHALSRSVTNFDHVTGMPSSLSYSNQYQTLAPYFLQGASPYAAPAIDPAFQGQLQAPFLTQPPFEQQWAVNQASTSTLPPYMSPMVPQHRQSRWSANYDTPQGGGGGGNQGHYGTAPHRSSSLPPRAQQRLTIAGQNQMYSASPGQYSDSVDYAALDRLHISPVMPRRTSTLRTAGPGFSVDDENAIMLGANLTSQSPFGGKPQNFITPSARQRQSGRQTSQTMNTVTGILIIHILEGRGIRAPLDEATEEGSRYSSDELYCVLEVDTEHRARTGVSNARQSYKWRETFEIDVINARQADIYIYSWHRQHRHKLCHRASLKLLEAFVVDRLSGERTFALTMQPSGQLLVRVGFVEMHQAYVRSMAPTQGNYFGLPLIQLVQRENSGVDAPILMRRVIDEIERRGVDSSGLYMLCGSTEKKRELRYYMERSPGNVDLGGDAVPDTNVLTSVLKDFLRELPTPLLPLCITRMLVDAAAVRLPNDNQGNARLAFGIIDCMPRVERCVLLVLMDHLKTVTQHSPHNHLGVAKLASIFGPLMICTSVQQQQQLPPDIAANAAKQGLTPRMGSMVNALDARLASSILAYLLDLWPMRCNDTAPMTSSIHMSREGNQLMDNWHKSNN